MALPFTFSSHFQFLSSGTNSYLCVGGGVGWGGVSSGVGCVCVVVVQVLGTKPRAWRKRLGKCSTESGTPPPSPDSLLIYKTSMLKHLI